MKYWTQLNSYFSYLTVCCMFMVIKYINKSSLLVVMIDWRKKRKKRESKRRKVLWDWCDRDTLLQGRQLRRCCCGNSWRRSIWRRHCRNSARREERPERWHGNNGFCILKRKTNEFCPCVMIAEDNNILYTVLRHSLLCCHCPSNKYLIYLNTYFSAYIHLRFVHTVLGTLLSCQSRMLICRFLSC